MALCEKCNIKMIIRPDKYTTLKPSKIIYECPRCGRVQYSAQDIEKQLIAKTNPVIRIVRKFEEDFVSFETAKLIKEKGFNMNCFMFYGKNETEERYILQRYHYPISNTELKENEYSAPTLQMAAKWIREEHSIHVYTTFEDDRGYQPEIYIINQKDVALGMYNGFSQEEALEAAINYSLKHLIK